MTCLKKGWGPLRLKSAPLNISLVQKLSDRGPPAKLLRGADFWS